MEANTKTKSQIEINQKSIDVMHEHALQAFPNECVGFFFGSSEEDHKHVLEAQAIPNSKNGDQRRRFEVSPIDYMKAERYAAENNVELLGIYHSHPLHPAIPSEHDRKQAVTFFSYIIVSVEKDKINKTTSWLLNEQEQFDEEEIVYKD